MEYDRLLTGQFISGLNNDGMVDEILKEVATLEGIDDTHLGACVAVGM